VIAEETSSAEVQHILKIPTKEEQILVRKNRWEKLSEQDIFQIKKNKNIKEKTKV